MKQVSYKKKIAGILVGLIGIVFALFGYVFPAFLRANESLASRVLAERKELLELKAEQRNFELGKRDLGELEKKTLQPGDFFSSDTSLVREIRVLEDLSRELGLTLSLDVVGTVATAPKAKATTELRTIPVTMQVSGPFEGVMQFLDSLEHLSFITSVKILSVNPGDKKSVNMSLVGNFYVKK